MNSFAEYVASLFIWLVLAIVFFLAKKVAKHVFLPKVNFLDCILFALFINAVFSLSGVKVVNYFTSRFDKIMFTTPIDESWGDYIGAIFFDYVLGIGIILMALLYLTLRLKK
jgi:hypothetical protein